MEEEKILNEAEAVKSDIPAEIKDLAVSSDLEAEEWNKLFKKYLNYQEVKSGSPETYYRITVKPRFTSELLKGKVGFLIYKGETGQKVASNGKAYTSVEPSDIDVTPNAADASLFTHDNAKTIISALQRIPKLYADYTLVKVDPQEAKKQLGQEQDLAKMIFDMYLHKAGNGIKEWLGSGYDTVYRICRTLRYPLAGNGFLKIFTEAYKDPNLKTIRPNSQFVWLINNVLADRVCTQKGLQTPKSFLNTLVFNSHL